MKRKLVSFPVEAAGLFGVSIYCAVNDSLVAAIIFAMISGRWIRQWLNEE
jgi:hypothetical protein